MGVSCCVIAARFSIYEVPYTTLFYSNILYILPPLFSSLFSSRFSLLSCHRGLRHYWGLTVRGQHTCTTGRKRGR